MKCRPNKHLKFNQRVNHHEMKGKLIIYMKMPTLLLYQQGGHLKGLIQKQKTSNRY